MRRLLIPILAAFFLLGGPGWAQTSVPRLAESYYHFSLAKLYHLNNRYSDAVREFERAISLDPDSPELRTEFAKTLRKMGQIRRAVEECQRAVEIDPNNVEAHMLLALIYYGYRGQGDISSNAREQFEKVIQLDPANFEAYYYLGELHLAEERFAEAASAFGRFIQLRPDFAEGYLKKAEAHRAQGQVEEAIKTLEGARQFGHQSAELMGTLGELYEETGDVEKALEAYRQGAERSEDLKLTYQLATLLMREGHHKEAIPYLQDLVRRSPQQLRLTLYLGSALREAKRFDEAVEVLKGLLDNGVLDGSLNFEARYQLALSLEGMGRRKEAIEQFLQLLSMSEGAPYRKDLKTHLALLYQKDQQLQEAIVLFQEMAEDNPGSVDPQLRLFYALKDAGRKSEADTLSEKLMAQAPEDPYVVIARAQAISDAGRLREAIRLLRERLQGPEHSETFYLAASHLYSDHKQYEEAEELLREGLGAHPDSERIQFQLGAVHERQKEYEEAERVFKQILEKNPEHAGVLNYLGYMLADLGIRLEEALGYIDKAVELDPYNGAYRDSLGWVYFKLDKLEEAEEHLTLAAELNHNDATILDHLGDLYRKLGDYDRAREYYQRSLFHATEEEESEKVKQKLADLMNVLSGR